MLALSHLLNKKAKILGFKLTSVPSHYFAYSQSHISNIVNNKSRLRPIKSPTIPRIVPAKGLTRSAIENIKTVKNAL
ncbi:hypothetical protein A2G94_05125 [Francisella endosymbiont of Ornithodoros moubata]|nr:hypothetical protein A2G94_05125 [Francisella endosymbiont of Ornithodoros moubata]